MAYSAVVIGTTKTKLREARGISSRMTGLGGVGVAIEGPLVLNPQLDPARRLVTPAIERYHTELWHASERSQQRPKNFKLAFLVRKMQGALDRWDRNGKGDRANRGPLSAVLICLDLIGWRMASPTRLIDHKGQPIDLLAGSPARLRITLAEAFQHQLLDDLMWKWVKNGWGTDVEFKAY
eukprot:11005381-Karenia_brevis.AAC.1